MDQRQSEPNKVVSIAKHNAVLQEHAVLTELLSSVMRLIVSGYKGQFGNAITTDQLMGKVPGLQEWWNAYQNLDKIRIADEIHQLLSFLDYNDLLIFKQKIENTIPAPEPRHEEG